jgi:hypothetical protein
MQYRLFIRRRLKELNVRRFFAKKDSLGKLKNFRGMILMEQFANLLFAPGTKKLDRVLAPLADFFLF